MTSVVTIEEYRNLVHKNTKEFDPKKALDSIKSWLECYKNSANMRKAIIGISGGKDSTVVAKILVDVLGKENVIGVTMPNGEQKDINDSIRVIDLLGIERYNVNISEMYHRTLEAVDYYNTTEEARINIAPRLRMTVLYTLGQSLGCRVAGTGNKSERVLGYFTKWGDGACDFNIIGEYTSLEVMRIGEELGLPLDLVYKTPEDGLSGMSDEEKLGLSYIDVHNYIRGNIDDLSEDVISKIFNKYLSARHKLGFTPIPQYYVYGD